jgi:hypothetical protein
MAYSSGVDLFIDLLRIISLFRFPSHEPHCLLTHILNKKGVLPCLTILTIAACALVLPVRHVAVTVIAVMIAEKTDAMIAETIAEKTDAMIAETIDETIIRFNIFGLLRQPFLQM